MTSDAAAIIGPDEFVQLRLQADGQVVGENPFSEMAEGRAWGLGPRAWGMRLEV